jgi:glycosyltransferase involved in cell wall biosynthesis
MTLEQCWHRVPGGTAVAALGMARALQAVPDLELVGVAARHPRRPPDEHSPPVEVFELPLPRILLYGSWHRWRRPKVQLATGRVDVIHATSIAMPPRSAPIVISINDLAWLKDPSHFTARGVRFFDRGLALALKDADIVLCPSQATVRDCEAAGFPAARLRFVPQGVDATKASEADIARVRARYGLPDPYLLWTGTIEPRKNLKGLLAAVRLLDRTIDVALVGPKGWNEDLDALIGDRREHVRALGYVPRRDLDALYAGAEVFCFPSFLEGFGFPVLEAMANGTPVVTSAGTSTEELVGEAGIVVDPRDPVAIARGLDEVLGDEALAEKLAHAGRERAGEFTWDRTARGVMDAYREAAA